MSLSALLTEARVMGDGRVVRLRWEMGVSVGQTACNRLASTGFPDDEPGINAGAVLSVNGQTAECIGTHSEDHNRPQSWCATDAPQQGWPSGGSLPVGYYLFQVVLVDSGGHEIVTHHWQGIGNTTSNDPLAGVYNSTAGAKTKIVWRTPCTTDGKVRIYSDYVASLAHAGPSETHNQILNMKLVAEVPYAGLDASTATVPAGCSFTLSTYSQTTPISYTSTTWWQDWLVPSPIPFGAPVTISAPAGLIQDELGNATEVIAANVATGRVGTPTITPANDSVVGTDGWLAIPDNPNTPNGTMTFAHTVYVSYSHGLDSNDGSKATPLKTMSVALAKYDSSVRNINVRLLRGDSWPAGEFWGVPHWGTSRATPFCIDSYWYDYTQTSRPDPGVRPVVNCMHSYWDAPNNQLVNSTFWYGAVGDSTPKGYWSYCVIRGISFVQDKSFISNYTALTYTGDSADSTIYSDCHFSNMAIVPSQTVPIIGGMVHRCIIHDVQAGTTDCGLVPQAAGGTTVTLVDRFAHPWMPTAATAGQTYLGLYLAAGGWNLANCAGGQTNQTTGWSFSISGQGNSETHRIAGPIGYGSLCRYPLTTGDSFQHTYTAGNLGATDTVVSLLPPDGVQFKILLGPGASGTTVYTISGYNSTTKTANVTPALPLIDSTTRVVWLPEVDQGNHDFGFFMGDCGDYIISQSTFDTNGWLRPDGDPKWNNPLSHNLYCSYQARKICFWGNWSINGCSYGHMQRGGGTIAYCTFTMNPYVTYTSSTTGCMRRNLVIGNGNYHFNYSAGFDDITNHVCHDRNIMMSPNYFVEDRITQQVNPALQFGNGPHADYAPKTVRARHNTFVDIDAMSCLVDPPNPGILEFRQNLVVNRPTTGVDFRGYGCTCVQVSVTNPQLPNGQFTLVNDDSWAKLDKNCYLNQSNHSDGFRFTNTATSKNIATDSFAAWKAAGMEPNSIGPATVTLANGTYTLASWASANGFGADITALRTSLKARQYQAWSDGYDSTKAYAAFQAAYTADSSNVPQVDSSRLGYYGATDNRAGNGGQGGPVIYRTRVGRGGQMFRHFQY